MCKTAYVLILNGRMPHYSSGNPIVKNISTIDYLYAVHCFFSISIILLYMMVIHHFVTASVLKLVHATGPIVANHIPCHMEPSVKRTVVRLESNKKNVTALRIMRELALLCIIVYLILQMQPRKVLIR